MSEFVTGIGEAVRHNKWVQAGLAAIFLGALSGCAVNDAPPVNPPGFGETQNYAALTPFPDVSKKQARDDAGQNGWNPLGTYAQDAPTPEPRPQPLGHCEEDGYSDTPYTLINRTRYGQTGEKFQYLLVDKSQPPYIAATAETITCDVMKGGWVGGGDSAQHVDFCASGRTPPDPINTYEIRPNDPRGITWPFPDVAIQVIDGSSVFSNDHKWVAQVCFNPPWTTFSHNLLDGKSILNISVLPTWYGGQH